MMTYSQNNLKELMMKKFMTTTLMVVIVLVAFFGMATANAYTVKAGDTLSKVAGKNWKVVCKVNNLKDCNIIRVGQELNLDVLPAKVSKTRFRTVPTNACVTLGTAPFNPGHIISRTLQGIDLLTTLTPGQKALAKVKVLFGMTASSNELVGQQVFVEMLYQSKENKEVVHVYDKLICSPEQGGVPEVMDTYDLGNGVFLSLPRRCGNVAVFMKTPESPPVPDESPPVVEETPPVIEVPVESSLEEPESLGSVCKHQVDAYTGAGKVWHNDSHYGYIGFDWYVKQWSFIDECGETHRLGFGGDYSAGSGQAGADGSFSWDAITLRPVAYKYTGTDGKTLRLRILITKIQDGVRADDDRYRNNRTIFEWGPEAIFTNQGRKDSGEKWFSEHRISASVLFAYNKSGSHSWEGTPITDTAELLQVKGMIRAGARLYVYDLDGGQRVFVQAGISVQWPNVARSLGISVGLDGPDELWTVFVGPNFDLKEHTHSFGAEVSLQIGKAYLYFKGLAKQEGLLSAVECIESDGSAYFPSTGLLVPGACPKDTETGVVPVDASQ